MKSEAEKGNMSKTLKDILPSVLKKQVVTQCDTLEQLVYHIIKLNNSSNKFIINIII